jgi:lysyl-tRNA synthetase class 2
MAEQKQSTLEEIIAQRFEKLADWRQRTGAYPNDFRRTHFAADLHSRFADSSREQLETEPCPVRIAGRMMTRRVQGKVAFAHLQDMSGQIQIFVQRDALPEGLYADFKRWDVGDILGATGTMFRTNKGELSVRVDALALLSKCLRPLPEKFHGLSDQETRYRQRYLDLIMNPESRGVFAKRSQIIDFIRAYLTARRFVEVETPMMQVIPGGAAARPFVTHHNSLDMDLYLRIAPELYLKRLLIGGIEQVFEINRSFRNEGLSTRHNPEFTMLEFYQAYATYEDLMDLSEDLLRKLAKTVNGTTVVTYQGQQYDLEPTFRRVTLKQSILDHNRGVEAATLDDLDTARALAERLEIPVQKDFGLGKIQLEIFEKTVEDRLQQPTFITGFPTEVSPLARRAEQDPSITDRFELFIGCREIANGFSELNDPEDQAERFRAQAAAKQSGDEEAMRYDADYIQALEYGMPPAAGEGIGIDRLVMLFTDSASIRDVLLFPHLRPR